MSWAEMDQELRRSYGVPSVVLSGIKLVSDLQALLQKHRQMKSKGDSRPPLSGVPVTMAAKDKPPIRPSSQQRPRLLSIGSESTDIDSSGADSDALNSSEECELVSITHPMCALPKSVRKSPRQLNVNKNARGVRSHPQQGNAAQVLLGLTRAKTSIKMEGISTQKRQAAELTDSEEIKPNKERIGVYTPRSRKQLLEKFHEKRKRRVWRKKVRYDCRKNFANNRVRVKGRFVKKDEQLGKGEQWQSYLLNKETETPERKAPEVSTRQISSI